MIGKLPGHRLLRGAALISFLVLFVLVPGLLLAQDADFEAHLQQNAAQLSAEGWPSGGDTGKTPTTDVECQALVKSYLKSKSRFESWWRGRRDQIRRDPNMTPVQKKAARADFRGKIRKFAVSYGQRYVAPIALYLKESVNYQAAKAGKKPRMPIRIAIGTKPNSPKWLGIISDIDLQGSPELVDAFHEKIKKVMAVARIDLGPSYMTEQLLDVTLHRMGGTGDMTPLQKLARMRRDAASKETYLCVVMEKDQPGRTFVELQDHMKKAKKGLTGDACKFYIEPENLRGTAKGLKKAWTAVPIDDAALGRCLQSAGMNMTPKEFRSLIDIARDGVESFTPEDMNITPENASNFQDAVGKILTTLHETELVNLQHELAKCKQAILVAEKGGNRKEAERLRKLYQDSRNRVVAATEANEGRYQNVKGLGPSLMNIRSFVEPLNKNKSLQYELVDFLTSVKQNRFMRRVAVLTLNHIAAKDPAAARDALEAAKRLDDTGELARDPELRKLAQDLDAVLSGQIRKDRPELTKEAALLAFTNRCRIRMARLNAFLDVDLKRNRSSQAISALVDKWGGVEEALAYWSAFRTGGVQALATEIVRFRIPLVENVVSGNLLRATWEIICRICPQAGVYYAAVSYAYQLTMMGVEFHWQSELDAVLDKLYQESRFKLVGVDTFDDIKLGRWQFDQTTYQGHILTRSDFLLEDTGVALGSVEAETTLRLTIAACDPVLAAFTEMLARKDIGDRLKPHIDAKWERRWIEVKRWWARETIQRLEERKQAEEGLLSGNLLQAMFKLDHALRQLEIEPFVRATMYTTEYKMADQAYILWQGLRSTVTGNAPDLYSGADDYTRPVILRLAAKELRYLRAYREILDIRREVEDATGLTGERDGSLRLLTGGPFFEAKPRADLISARKFIAALQKETQGIAARLVGIKSRFIKDATLSSEYDRQMRADLLRESAWESGWRIAHLTLAAHYQPDDWDVARDAYSVFFNHEQWKLLFLQQFDEATAQVRLLARQFLIGGTTSMMRKSHRSKIQRLYAEFTAHYAGEVTGKVRILVRRQDKGTKTKQPVSGATVTWAFNDQVARETSPGVYEFHGLQPGDYRFLAQAEGFSALDGNPAAVAVVTLPEAVGPVPTATLYLVADDLAVRGFALDERDGAVPWAVLRLVPVVSADAPLPAAVGPDGAFTFVPVKAGGYRLTAKARGFAPCPDLPVQVDLPTRAGIGPVAPIIVKFDPILSEVVITLVDDAGKFVTGAEVQLLGEAAVTNDRGTVGFVDVRPTPGALVSVRAKGYAPVRRHLVILPNSAPSRIERTIELKHGAGIQVSVIDFDTGNPVPEATVAVSYEKEYASAATDSQGVASISNLRPGFVYVSVVKPGYLSRDNIEIDLTNTVDGEMLNFTISIEMGMRLKVLVKDDRGELIPGAYVSLDHGLDRFAPTGTTVLVPVKPGAHTIRAKGRGFTEEVLEYVADPAIKPEDTVVLTLSPGISLSVEVRGPGGALYHSGSVIRLIRDGQIVATANGPVHTFSGLLPGQYMAGAVAPGESMSVAGPIQLSAVPTAATLVVTLGIPTSLRVTVTAAPDSAYPLPSEVTVRLVGQGREMMGMGSQVQFDNLVSGAYVAHASAPGFVPGGRNVMLAPKGPGQIFGSTIVLSPLAVAPPPPPPPPPPGKSILAEITRSDVIIFSLDLPVRMESSATFEPAKIEETVARFSSGLSGRVSWRDRTFILLAEERETEYRRETFCRTEVRGTLSPDGRTIEKLVFTEELRGNLTYWLTVRDIPGEPRVKPVPEKVETWTDHHRVVLRNIPLRHSSGTGLFSFDLQAADLTKLVVLASSSGHYKMNSIADTETDLTSSYLLLSLNFPGNEGQARLRLSFSNSR